MQGGSGVKAGAAEGHSGLSLLSAVAPATSARRGEKKALPFALQVCLQTGRRCLQEEDMERVQACSGMQAKDVYADLHGYVLQEKEGMSWKHGLERQLFKYIYIYISRYISVTGYTKMGGAVMVE